MNSNGENNKNINLESFTVKGIDSPSEHQDMIYNQIDGIQNQIDDIQESFNDYWFSLYHEMENEFKSLKFKLIFLRVGSAGFVLVIWPIDEKRVSAKASLSPNSIFQKSGIS